MPVESLFASPDVLCGKNNGMSSHDPEAWSFGFDYNKLNTNTHILHFSCLISGTSAIKKVIKI